MRGADMAAKVWFVGAGPGNPELITVKGLSLLKQADVLIYAGSLVNPELVALSGATTKLDSWGMQLEDLVTSMEIPAKSGKTVVRLHSGDPSLYGAIVEQIEELEKRGVFVEIVPGVSIALCRRSCAWYPAYASRGVRILNCYPPGRKNTGSRPDQRTLSP